MADKIVVEVEEQKGVPRYIYFDILRVIAAFAVIMLHVSAHRFYVSFPSNEWEWLNVYDSLSRWGVPIFVMISGALFLNANKVLSIKKLFKKNIVRILTALLFWSLVYELYQMNENTTLLQFVYGVIMGPVHLWFLKMLLGLYVVVPILRLVVKDKKIELYFLILAFITTFVIPYLPKVLGLFDPNLIHASNKLIETINLQLATGYTGYFVLGHYLRVTSISQLVKRMIYSLGLLSFICVIVLTSMVSHFLNFPIVFFYNNLFPLSLLEAAAIFVFVHDKAININSNHQKVIINVSKLSFGIYLIHYLIIKIINDNLGLNSSSFNPILYVPCITISVFMISYLASFIISKIPFAKKYII